MAVSLIVNGIPELQQSLIDGLTSLQRLLSERCRQGCTISPTQQAAFGTAYRIHHPGAVTELVCLTDDLDLADGTLDDIRIESRRFGLG